MVKGSKVKQFGTQFCVRPIACATQKQYRQGKENLFQHSLNDDKAYKTVDWRWRAHRGKGVKSRLMDTCEKG
jgi:hypothetical protein